MNLHTYWDIYKIDYTKCYRLVIKASKSMKMKIQSEEGFGVRA